VLGGRAPPAISDHLAERVAFFGVLVEPIGGDGPVTAPARARAGYLA
jgi:hypothetical protein